MSACAPIDPPLSALSRAAGGARVALGHDWLTGMRGGERVLEWHCRAFPDAPIATLVNVPGAVSGTIASHPIRASWFNRLPGVRGHYRSYLPIMPLAARTLRVPDCELLLTSSHCVAKSFRKPRGARHVCYCFSPMRYAWLFREEYFPNPVKRALAAPLLAWLRAWDRRTAAGVDRFVAISGAVADRIRRFYGRESDVVYPPVDVSRCTPAPDGIGRDGGFDLIVSALVPYKRIDLAVRAYARRGWRLKVVGVGGQLDALRALAGPTVEVIGWLPDADVLELYRHARLLLFPGEEDFGIVPLEAQACGLPVVAYARGGALETVRDGVSGVFFREQTEEALAEAVEDAARRRWDTAAVRANALAFGPERFLSGLAASVRAAVSPDNRRNWG